MGSFSACDVYNPAKQENIPVLRTKGKYRKEMKRGYSNIYHQRSKDNEVFSVVKRVMGGRLNKVSQGKGTE